MAKKAKQAANGTAPAPFRVALYCRVSTVRKNKDGTVDEDDERQQDPNVQLMPLREHAKRQGWNVVGEYIDRGVSGSKETRPELDRMIQDAGLVCDRGIYRTLAHGPKFDAIAVWKLDRFGRSLKNLISAISALGGQGVAFISLREQIDLSTPAGRLMFQMLAAFAEFEREMIRERVRAGMVNAKRKGKQVGHPSTVTQETKATIHRLRGKGLGWREIAARVNLSVGTCHGIGKRPR